MKTTKIIGQEVEILDKAFCDFCKREIEYGDVCGGGVKYTLSDARCKMCGGEIWDFCSLDCLKKFVEDLKEET